MEVHDRGLGPLATGWAVCTPVLEPGYRQPSRQSARNTREPRGYSLAEWTWLRRSLPLSCCLALLVLACVGGFVCGKHGLWKHPAVAALTLWLLAHEIVYRSRRVPFAPWYHEALVNAVLILAALGAVALGRALLFWQRVTERRTLMPTLVADLCFCRRSIVPTVSYVWTSGAGSPISASRSTRTYRPIGARMPARNRRCCGRSRNLELSKVPILDLSGLVTPDVIGARSQRRLGQLVVASGPDYILDVPQFRDNVLVFLRDPEVLKAYRTGTSGFASRAAAGRTA